jgi:hypothetical protein
MAQVMKLKLVSFVVGLDFLQMLFKKVATTLIFLDQVQNLAKCSPINYPKR